MPPMLFGGGGDATAANQANIEAKIDIIDANVDTLVRRAQCDVGMVGSTTTIVCGDLAGYTDDYFNTGWQMLVLLNVNSHGNVPEGDGWRDITNYDSATGTFTVVAFSANVEENDYILVARDEFVSGGGGGGDYDPQVFPTTIDLHQAAASYDVATCGSQDVLIKEIVICPRIDVSDDATITYVTFQTNHATVQTFINSTQGAKANLGQQAQVAWIGSVLLKVGSKIQFTIGGGSADADPTTVDVVITYVPTVSGGVLA